MTPPAPKTPSGIDWDAIEPRLSPEQLCSIGELSSAYLGSESAELSGDSLVSSLQALYKLSLTDGGKMKREHAEAVKGIVIHGELEFLSGRVGELSSLVSEKEAHAKSLHSKLAAAQQAHAGEIGKLNAKLKEKDAELKRHREAAEKLHSEREGHTTEVARLRSELEGFAKRHQESVSSLRDSHAAELQKLNGMLSSLSKQNHALQAESAHLHRRHGELVGAISKALEGAKGQQEKK
jgi:chromosome segregation ATPase